MKKIASLFAVILSGSCVMAQDSYFMNAGFGAGVSASSFKVFSADAYNNHRNIFSDQFQLNLGYAHGSLQVETGVGYLRTGVSFVKAANEPLCGTPNPNPTIEPVYQGPDAKYTIRNPHVTIPLIVSYAVHLGKKISLDPGAGVEVAFNIPGTITSDQSGSQVPLIINYKYHAMSDLALVKCDVQYKLCEHMSVWISPSYQQMFTSLTQKVQGDYMSNTYDHAFLLNVGVRYNFQHLHLANDLND